MPGYFGTEEGHSGAKRGASNLSWLGKRIAKRSRRAREDKWDAKDRKTDFKNKAKLMKYQADLEDWQQTQFHGVTDRAELLAGGGHIGAAGRAARKASEFSDDEGNVLGASNFSYSSGRQRVNMGGYRLPARAKEEAGEEEAPSVTPRQFAGANPVMLGTQIPVATSENSYFRPGEKLRMGTGKPVFVNGKPTYPMARQADVFKKQQSIQDEQGRQWHEQANAASRQGTLFDEEGNPNEEAK